MAFTFLNQYFRSILQLSYIADNQRVQNNEVVLEIFINIIIIMKSYIKDFQHITLCYLQVVVFCNIFLYLFPSFTSIGWFSLDLFMILYTQFFIFVCFGTYFFSIICYSELFYFKLINNAFVDGYISTQNLQNILLFLEF